MRLFIRWFLPLVVAIAVTQQGCHYASVLVSVKSDLAVFAGVVLGLTSVFGFGSFVLTWFKEPINKVIGWVKDNL